MKSKAEPTRFKNAKVYYRILPMQNMQWDHVKILDDMKTLYVRCLQDFSKGAFDVIPNYWCFSTDGIFYHKTQLEIYDTIICDILDKVIDGCNVIILSFGQSGSGKSLTANGLHHSFKDRGIAPRLITDLYQKKEVLHSQTKMCILLSYIETKGKNVRDLFGEDSNRFIRSLREITLNKVADEDSAMSALFKAESKREYSENSTSSHGANGVFTITVVTKPAHATDPIKKTSKVHIVDLGGADTYGNITSFNKDISQVGNANAAKSQLEEFFLVLLQNQPDCIHVKQRSNTLIQYLGDSLNTHSVLRCIGHLRIDFSNLYIVMSMLHFGQHVRGLKPSKLKPNLSKDEEIEIKILETKILEMRKENDLNVMLGTNDLASNISQDRILQMQRVAREYLKNHTNELVVVNVSDVNTILKVFKDLYNKLELEKEECSRIAYEQAYNDALINGPPSQEPQKNMDQEQVSDLKIVQLEFGVRKELIPKEQCQDLQFLDVNS